MGANEMTYQRLSPCVDARGHRFDVSNPEPGQWGHSIIFCTRCGATRAELLLAKRS